MLKVGGEGNKPCSQMVGAGVRRVMGWLSAASVFYLSCDNAGSSEGSRGGRDLSCLSGPWSCGFQRQACGSQTQS